MSRVIFVAVVVLLLVLGGVYFVMSSDSDGMADSGDGMGADGAGDGMIDFGGGAGGSVMGEPDVVFTLTGGNYYFEMDSERNPDLVVSEGDLVRIEFTSEEGFHDWVVDEFDAATDKVRSGEDGMVYVEFVADQKGTFEYYCSVGSHRANGMKGMLVVE